MPHRHRPSVPALYATPWLKNVKKKNQTSTPPSRSCAILQDVDTISCLSLCLNPLCSTLSLLSVTRQLHSSHPSLSLYPPPAIQWLERPFPIMLCLHLTHQTVAVPAARAPAQITTRQLIELFFSSQAGGHCKNIPTLEYGFLVQVRHRGHFGWAVKELSVISVSLCCMQDTVLAI